MAKVKSAEESREYWNDLSESYEKFYTKVTMQVNTLLIPHLNLDSSHTIAECGCGTGSGIQLLLNNFPNISKILASDLSDQMIQIAQSKSFPNTELTMCNNESLPYDSESCDRYISNLSLHYAEHPEIMLREAFRVLKTGGIAVLSVWGRPEENNIFKIIGRVNVKAGIELPKERNPFFLSDQNLVNELARNAGFSNVRSFYGSIPCIFNTVEDFLLFVGNRKDIFILKQERSDVYEKLMNEFRLEYSRVAAEGKFFTFEFLAVVGEKSSN